MPSNKRILYIATAKRVNPRLLLIEKILQENYQVTSITSAQNTYIRRLLSIYLRVIFQLIFNRRKYDCVFIGFMPQFAIHLIRLLWSGELICDFFFSLHDSMVHDRRYTQANSLLAKLIFYLDHYTLAHSTKIICDTNEHINYYRTTFQTGRQYHKLYIGVLDDYFKSYPLPKLDEPLIITFHGFFIPLQGVDVILKAAKILEEQNIPVSFNLIGEGQTYQACLKLHRELNLSTVKFLGYQDQTAISSALRQSHIGLGIFGNTAKTLRVIPNKAFEVLAMNRLLITAKTAAVEELLKDNHDAILISPNTPQKLAEAIQKLYHNRDIIESIAQNGNQTFTKQASYPVLRKQLIEIIDDSGKTALEQLKNDNCKTI